MTMKVISSLSKFKTHITVFIQYLCIDNDMKKKKINDLHDDNNKVCNVLKMCRRNNIFISPWNKLVLYRTSESYSCREFDIVSAGKTIKKKNF